MTAKTIDVPAPRTADPAEMRRVIQQLNAQIAALERRVSALERAGST